ncbi:MAG: hypothetical protein GY765_32795 [bacterium]|nr:hypothetical protein [bacterium]
MSKLDRNMLKIGTDKDNDVGLRFMLFRKAVEKDNCEFAAELRLTEDKVADIEAGILSPEITQLHILHYRYKLNINWLLTGTGFMFVGKDSEKPLVGKYSELLALMEVPAVAQAIGAALLEIKALLELEKENENTISKTPEVDFKK